MTGRERIVAAINHRVPDRVPIDLAGTRDSSIVVEGYQRLKRHFGIEGPDVLCDRMMRVVQVDERMLKALDVDTRAVFADAALIPDSPEPSYTDGWGVERVRMPGGYYYDQEKYPLSGEISISDIARYRWPDPDARGLTRGLKERLARVRQNTQAAAILTLPAPMVHLSQYLRGFEDWFIDFAADPSLLEAMFDAVLEVTMRMAYRTLAEVGRDVDIVICADDLGTQGGLQMSPADYRRYIRPRHERYFRQVHEMTGAKLMFHSCGSLAAIVDDLVEIGVDILNPVQTTAAGMEPGALKRKYRGRLAFWGAMDTQHVLPHGSVGDVRRMVEQRIEEMGEGGGYVLASCHNLQPDVPTENILAMFEHAREYVPSFAR